MVCFGLLWLIVAYCGFVVPLLKECVCSQHVTRHLSGTLIDYSSAWRRGTVQSSWRSAHSLSLSLNLGQKIVIQTPLLRIGRYSINLILHMQPLPKPVVWAIQAGFPENPNEVEFFRSVGFFPATSSSSSSMSSSSTRLTASRESKPPTLPSTPSFLTSGKNQIRNMPRRWNLPRRSFSSKPGSAKSQRQNTSQQGHS